MLDRGVPRPDVPVPAGCAFAAVGAATLLFDCSSASVRVARARLVDLATGVLTEAPEFAGFRNTADGPSMAFQDVGRSWLRVHVFGYHSYADVYLSRDGRAVQVRAAPPRDVGRPLRVFADLDEPGLWVHACGSLSVPRDPEYQSITGLGPAWMPFAYGRPWLAFTGPQGGIHLQRCGQARERRIAPAR